MSTNLSGRNISLAAAADLTAKQFYAIKIDTNGLAAVAGAGEAGIGILQNNPGLGQSAAVQVDGISKARAGATIAAGAPLASNASGLLITATTGNYIIGFAKEAAVVNDIFACVLEPLGKF